jgi:hypothetical protein
MKNIILTLSLFGCSSNTILPIDEYPEYPSDTVEDSDVKVLEVPDTTIDGREFVERCTTIIQNRDEHIAPKEKELRPKICNLTGIDQLGREITL